jgi:hypothetical protein
MTQEGFLSLSLPKRRLAIAGYVIDGVNKRPIAGASVAITNSPEAFHKLVAIAQTKAGSTWSSLAVRLDRMVSKADGGFHFVDLPDGTIITVRAGGAIRWDSRHETSNVTWRARSRWGSMRSIPTPSA